MIFGLTYLIYLQLCIAGAAAALFSSLFIITYYTQAFEAAPWFGVVSLFSIVILGASYWRVRQRELVMFAEIARWFYPVALLVILLITALVAGAYWELADNLRKNALVPAFAGLLMIGFIVIKWLETPFLPNLRDSGVGQEENLSPDAEEEGLLSRVIQEESHQARTLEAVAESLAYLDGTDRCEILLDVVASARLIQAEDARHQVLKSVLGACEKLGSVEPSDFFLPIVEASREFRPSGARSDLVQQLTAVAFQTRGIDLLSTLQAIIASIQSLNDERARRDILRNAIECCAGHPSALYARLLQIILDGTEALNEDGALRDILRSATQGLRNAYAGSDSPRLFEETFACSTRIRHEDMRATVWGDLADATPVLEASFASAFLDRLVEAAGQMRMDVARAIVLSRVVNNSARLKAPFALERMEKAFDASSLISSEGHARDVLRSMAEALRELGGTAAYPLLRQIVERAATLQRSEPRGIVLRAAAATASTIGGDEATPLLKRIVECARSTILPEQPQPTDNFAPSFSNEPVGSTPKPYPMASS